jgi:alpha-beta hydrolase superfamily lysophospholipase
MKTLEFKGVGGLKIFARSWRPDAQAPRALVVVSHGVLSHSGYYEWAAEQLVAAGFAVYAIDHRGRGHSEGERFFVETVDHYVEDVATLIELAKSRDPGIPAFLLGHSAGGVVACVYALEHQDRIAGLVCESFAFQVYAPDLALAAVKGLSHVFPHAHVLKLPIEEFSRNPAAVEAMKTDPLIAGEVQPTTTVAALVRADERLDKEFALIKLPVLILHGTADKVTKPGGSEMFHDKAGSTDKTLKLYEGHAHDLLNDLDREIVMADIRDWLLARVPAKPR